MLKVALTGNIASGKTMVAEVWRDLGGRVLEADELARRAVEPGTEGLRRIVEHWGPGILGSSGELDRAALRDVVFRDSEERRRLEEIVHPEVHRLRRLELAAAAAEGLDLIVADIPLLFEVGMQDDFDVVVFVDAPEAIRRERLIDTRGLDAEEAQRMIDAQWPAEKKRSRADIVIDNRGTRDQLEARAAEVWAELRVRAASRQEGG